MLRWINPDLAALAIVGGLTVFLSLFVGNALVRGPVVWHFSTDIAAPPELVYPWLVEPEKRSAWQPRVADIVATQGDPGAVGREHLLLTASRAQGFLTGEDRITAADPPRRVSYAQRWTLKPSDREKRADFAEDRLYFYAQATDTGTRLHMTVMRERKGWKYRIGFLFKAGAERRAFDRGLSALKARFPERSSIPH